MKNIKFKGTMDASEYIIGYIFKGKYFKNEDDMRGMTMSEGNTPIKIYAPEYVEALAIMYKQKSDKIMEVLNILIPKP